MMELFGARRMVCHMHLGVGGGALDEVIKEKAILILHAGLNK